MELRVRLFAGLRERARADEIVLRDLPSGLDAAALKREVETRHPALGSLAHVAVVVGTEYVQDARPITAGDQVSLLPPVSGGSGRGEDEDEALAHGVFELCASPLEPARAAERVLDPSCGAVVTFTGTTRAENRGQRVVRLEYEAFDAMTGPEMRRIFAACRRELEGAERPLLRMIVQHRIGAVSVGDPSVVIAVASPHRDAAFRAARFLIDELKRSLPIWKKELYQDGHHWIGERS
jgi:molybdopterin synthase catalytic subunit/molybdopterin converting factor small subunit